MKLVKHIRIQALEMDGKILPSVVLITEDGDFLIFALNLWQMAGIEKVRNGIKGNFLCIFEILKEILEKGEGKVERVVIDSFDVERQAIRARLEIEIKNQKFSFPVSAGDGVGIAICLEAPIYVEEKVLETYKMERERWKEERKGEMKETLKSLNEKDMEKYKV